MSSADRMVTAKLGATVKDRCAEAERLRVEHGNRIPLILKETGGLELCDNCFLVQGTMDVATLLRTLRKSIATKPKRLYFSADHTRACLSTTFEELYRAHGAEDGFLYGSVSTTLA